MDFPIPKGAHEASLKYLIQLCLQDMDPEGK